MGSDKGAQFTLPSIPYFYHDIVARIIPGMIQLGLIASLAAFHSAQWAKKLEAGPPTSPSPTAALALWFKELKALPGISQIPAVLMLLAAAYFIGALFEGAAQLAGANRLAFPRAFSWALTDARRNHGAGGLIDAEEVVRLAEETSSILESYEPVVPHFFARAARFLAEAKMMFFSALAVPIAVLAVGIGTGHWWPPGGWRGIASGLALMALFFAGAFARAWRRAVEILRCVQYLALRAEPDNRAREAWTRVLAQPPLPAPEQELPDDATIEDALG